MAQDRARPVTCPHCGGSIHPSERHCRSCGRSPAGLLRPGTIIGSRYEILATLGRGGMGTVYKAHDRILDEDMALKVLRSDIGDSPALNQRFLAEIKLARRVSHPNVCRIHEYGEHGDLRYISMELVSGADLREVLRQGPLPVAEAMEVSVQIASGLEAIHNAGIIHRDLKTPNIMRDERGHVRLMDFGIAKQWDLQGAGVTSTGQLVGTPEYMSPEQARGERIDFRSDIYALGVVLFEVLAGEVPFTSDSPLATLYKHIKEPPPLDGPQAARIPDAMVPLLAKMLQKDPNDRYATAGEVVADLWNARAQLQAGLASARAETPGEATAQVPALPCTTPTPPPSPSGPTPAPRSATPPPVLPRTTPTPPPRPSGPTPPPAPRPATPPPARPRLTVVRPVAASETPSNERRTEIRPVLPAGRPLSPSDSQRLEPPPLPQSPPAPATVRVCSAPPVPPPTRAPSLFEGPAKGPRGGLSLTAAAQMGSAAALVVIGVLVLWHALRNEAAVTAQEREAPPTTAAAPSPQPPSRPRLTPAPSPAAAPTAEAIPRTIAAPAPRPSPTPPRRAAAGHSAPTPSPPLPPVRGLPDVETRDSGVLLPKETIPSLSDRPPAPTPQSPPGPVGPALAPAATQSSTRIDSRPPQAAPAVEPLGTLKFDVQPWAEITVDGRPLGNTPIRPLALAAGSYVVRLTHPDFHPLQRKVTIRPGEVARLQIDLTQDAFPKTQ